MRAVPAQRLPLRLAPAAGILAVAALSWAQPSTATQGPSRAGAANAAVAVWSAPATLAQCPTVSDPAVVFPSDGPQHSTGAGATVWSVPKAGCGGPAGIRIARLGSDDQPGEPAPLGEPGEGGLRLSGLEAATGAAGGKIVLVGAGGAAMPEKAAGYFTEGIAGGTFSKPAPSGGPAAPVAVATAYLGDVAIVSLGDTDPRAGGVNGTSAGTGAGGEALQVRLERHYAKTFGVPVTVSAEGAGIGQIAAALDFRSEALVAWQRDGAVHAVTLGNHGQLGTEQRLGSAGRDSQIAALNSDDHRGVIAWSTEEGGVRSVFADVSAPGGDSVSHSGSSASPAPPDSRQGQARCGSSGWRMRA